MPTPIYTSENCKAAYQLYWVHSLFWRTPPGDTGWFEELKRLTEDDGIRLLQHKFEEPNVSKLLVSTKPEVAPRLIAQRVKGRLQHLIRERLPDAFRRNYAIRSVGSTKRENLEKYLEGQLRHHPMADTRIGDRFEQYQMNNAEVDLSRPSETTHARYWYNLHLVMVNEERWREVNESRLAAVRDMIVKAAAAKGHWLSRGAIVADHVHLTMRCKLEESPQDVALPYMNNVAYALGMKPALQFSYFVGTFGEYDLGVIPRPTAQSFAPPTKVGGGDGIQVAAE
jgi:REP element-mobilizing transposase RayT